MAFDLWPWQRVPMEIMGSPSGDGSLGNIRHSHAECRAFVYNGDSAEESQVFVFDGDSDEESQGSGSAGKVRCYLGDLGTGG